MMNFGFLPQSGCFRGPNTVQKKVELQGYDDAGGFTTHAMVPEIRLRRWHEHYMNERARCMGMLFGNGTTPRSLCHGANIFVTLLPLTDN